MQNQDEVIVEEDELICSEGTLPEVPALDWRSKSIAILGDVTESEHQILNETFQVGVDDPHATTEVDCVDADLIIICRRTDTAELVRRFRRSREHRYTPILALFDADAPPIETTICMVDSGISAFITQAKALLWLGQAWSLARLQVMSASDALVIVERGESIYLLNPAAERLFGYLNVEVVDRPVSFLFDDLDLVSLTSMSSVVPKSGKDGTECSALRQDGSRFHASVSAGSVLLQSGLFISLVVSDISLQKELENERARALHTSRLAAIGEMVSFVAHEINSPLAVINGRVKLLRSLLKRSTDGIVSPSFPEHIDSIERMVSRIDTIVRNTLHLARSGEQDPMEEIPFINVVSDTLDICEAAFAKANIALKIEVDKTLKVQCRAVQLSQVILNILTNALDAIRADSSLPTERRWVRLTTEVTTASIGLRIANGGPPIAPHVLSGLFRETTTTKRIGAGTGLGLRVSKGIMQGLGGDLRLDDEELHTCFVISLPFTCTNIQ